MLNLSLVELARIIPAVLLGLTIHEFSHSIVAIKLGDDTPKVQGRMSLNPLKHIDPIGFILLMVLGFGWAKPVRIDREKLKNPVRDDILISLAGPFSNLLFAFILSIILKIVLLSVTFASPKAFQNIYSVFLTFIWINTGLAVFNLLPIPPLDGSHLIINLISLKSYPAAAKYFKYGSYLLLVLIILNRLVDVDLFPVGRLMDFIIGWIFSLLAIV